jgi:hypothetical protein
MDRYLALKYAIACNVDDSLASSLALPGLNIGEKVSLSSKFVFSSNELQDATM